MGGGPATLSGHLLLTLPWPEPTEVTDRIRKEHPDLKITYIEVGGRRSREPGKVPDGKLVFHCFEFRNFWSWDLEGELKEGGGEVGGEIGEVKLMRGGSVS